MDFSFRKRDGKIQGLLVREMFEGFQDGDYLGSIERVDREKHSAASNRLMFGAIVNEVARYLREEGSGKAVPPAAVHTEFKRRCLWYLNQVRSDAKQVTKWVKLPNGKRFAWQEMPDGRPRVFTSTTQLNSKEFSEYVRLACAVAKEHFGYPYEFDFLTA